MHYMKIAPVLHLLDEYINTLFNANEKHAWRPEFESTQGEKKQESNEHELHSALVLQGFFLGQSPSTDLRLNR